MENIICKIEQLKDFIDLSSIEEKKLRQIIQRHPMRVTPYYMSLIDWDDPCDPIRKMAIPSVEELSLQGSYDTSGEAENTKMWFSLTYSLLIDPLLHNVRSHVAEFAGMEAGDTVLDVCCGTGSQVFHYAREGMVATGIDLNPGMVKLAEKNKGKVGLNDASFQIADAASLPFRDNLFDYVSISLSIHTNQKKVRDKIISEMKRVVKKEGSLIFIDFRVPLPKNIYAYLARAIEFIAGHYRYFRDYIEHGGLDGIFKQNRLIEEKREYRKSNLMYMLKAKSI